ncbi:trichohyalin-like [Notolabrus celidotus]|uniref:trichohyalin-like n=1 Tax=Notolabrus celidotus TaxID=1203425 RepID=UPI00148FB708|nr:trichohyalin-like [Notolabrus celidotus]
MANQWYSELESLSWADMMEKEMEAEEMVNKIKELQELVENKDNQLQAERLRADTLQKEKEEYRREVEDKASQILKILEMQKLSLDSSCASQDIKLQNSKVIVLSHKLQTCLDEATQKRGEMAEGLMRQEKELVDLRRETNTQVKMESLKNELQAERLRADTLQKEQEEFRREVQEKASQDLKKVQNLEVEKLSLEQEVKALRIENNMIQELVDLIAAQDTQLQKKMVVTRVLRTRLDKAKVKLDEMAESLMRKDQELIDLRRVTYTEEHMMNMNMKLVEQTNKCSGLNLQLQDQVKVGLALREEVKELQEEVSSRALEDSTKIQELHDLVESLKNQLQAESLRADTLQKEKEEFRREVQEKASQDLKKVQNLEVEKLSLEQEVKALRLVNNKIQELVDLIAAQDTQLQKKMVVTRVLRTRLDKAKVKLDEMAESLMRKDQELIDLRRVTYTEEHMMNMNMKLVEQTNKCSSLNLQLQDQVKVGLALREEVKELQEEVSSRALEDSTKIQELHDIVESFKNQLQAESLRADTLQREQEQLRQRVQDLEVEKLSLEQGVKALQEEIRNNTNMIQEPQDVDASSKNQLQIERLDEPKRLIEKENGSLWRRFKKAMTPHSSRQYKHLRRLREDQEGNPSTSVPPVPPQHA